MPVYQIDDLNQAKAQPFTCLTWVRAALEDLGRQGAVAELGEWGGIQKKALDYVERKREVGRWSVGWKGEAGVPMLDSLKGREIFI